VRVIPPAMRIALMLLLTTTACASYKPIARTVRSSDVNNVDRTRLTGRFTWDEVGSKDLEYPPPGQSPASVTDEAVLAVTPDNRLCVYFTMRTGAKHDAPFGEWGIKINGEPVFAEQETTGQNTVYAEGERTVVDAAFVGKNSVAGLTVTQPTTDEYAIIQRAAYFCPTAVPAGKVAFTLQRDYARMSMREEFVWTILN